MYPTSTTYNLVSSPRDYSQAHSLLRSSILGDCPRLQFPTVLARRDGIVIGILSTSTKDGMVLAGPLAISPTIHRPIFIAIRLIESYENVLRMAGVAKYLFGVNKDRPAWAQAIQKCGFLPYQETSDSWWFLKEIV